jgi:exosortase A-associated hydrolase 2
MPPPDALIDAFFLDAAPGQRFCLLHTPAPQTTPLGHVLYIHPLGEEMNASRRMAAVQARAFANAGYAVLQIDLLGCGDSSGDFEDASWAAWLADVLLARQWLRERWPGSAWLWGLRAGCLLAAQASQQDQEPARLLLWQPVLSGKQHLNQFLRLQLAGDIARGQPSLGTAPLAQRLAQGQSVEVGGYCMSAALAQGMAQVDLDRLRAGTSIRCLEMGDGQNASPSPALGAQLQRWRDAGCDASAQVLSGAAFWQMQECPDSPAWIAASLQVLQSLATRGSA